MIFNKEKIDKIKLIIQIFELVDINNDNKTLKKISIDYNVPIEIINYITTSKIYLYEIITQIENYINEKITENNLLQIMKHTQKKNIFRSLIDYACISNIKDINRNYIKYEFEKEKFRFEEHNPNKEYIYDNQKLAALEVTKSFLEQNKKAVSLIALPQVGKTGTFLYVAYLMTTYNSNSIIEPENIFIITGMSDKSWEEQTKKDMLPQFKKNVYHHGKLTTRNTYNNNLDNFKSAIMKTTGRKLLIIDESHHGTQKTQTMDKIICEIFNIKTLIDISKIDCLILSVSATPGITLKDLRKLDKYYGEVYITPSINYISFKLFIEQNRIEKSENISETFLLKIKNKIDERYKNNYKYHIFRLSNKYRKIMESFCDKYNYICKKHDSDEKISVKTYNLLNYTFLA